MTKILAEEEQKAKVLTRLRREYNEGEEWTPTSDWLARQIAVVEAAAWERRSTTDLRYVEGLKLLLQEIRRNEMTQTAEVVKVSAS